MEEVRHNCGFCVAHTLHDVYNFMINLQNRGEEAAGIAAIGDNKIDVLKWEGFVTDFGLSDLHKILPGHDYKVFLGHVRYATRGKKDQILYDAHPHFYGGKVRDRGNHLIITDCDAVIVHNGQVDKSLLGIDEDKLMTGCDSEALLHYYIEKSEKEIIRNVPGAYTLAIADKRRRDVVVLRDRTGIKPGVLGQKDGKYCIASEDNAIIKNGGRFFENILPGSAYYISLDGNFRKEKVCDKKLKQCFFEWNYIADLDSAIDKIGVRRVRENIGEVLAEEFCPKDADLVTFLPRCPERAAYSYSGETGMPFAYVFYKKKGNVRSFLGSTAEIRKDLIEQNLFVLHTMEDKLKGKTLILIDDSMVRGNNAPKSLKLLSEVGVKKVYLVSYTPPIGIVPGDDVARGCLFGVDMPPEDNFIARNRSLEEISEKLSEKVGSLIKSIKLMIKSGLVGR